MWRRVLVAGAVVLLVGGCGSSVSDEEWHWCQGHIEVVQNAYVLDSDLLAVLDSHDAASGARIDWFFRQGDDSTRSNRHTLDACKAAYAHEVLGAPYPPNRSTMIPAVGPRMPPVAPP